MFPIQILIREGETPGSKKLETSLKEKAEKLERYCKKIQRCKIVVDIEQKHQRRGRPFSVHIDLHVPNKMLSATQTNTSLWAAVRDAFAASRKQLLHYAGRRHHHISLQHHRNAMLNGKGETLQSAA